VENIANVSAKYKDEMMSIVDTTRQTMRSKLYHFILDRYEV